MKLLRLSIIAIISVLAISWNVQAQKMDKSNKNMQINFPQKAYSGGMMEVKLGKLAQQKATSEKVKEFGERMINDHSKANDELKNIAQKNNIPLPDSMLSKNQNLYNDLSQYSGSEFDRHYMDKMVEDHKEDIKTFEDAAKNADNQEIRDWAKKTLPVLKQHLELAQQAKNDVNQSK